MNIIGRKKWFLGTSAVVVGAAITAIAVFGFTLGIDFTSGALWQVRVPQEVTEADLRSALTESGAREVTVTRDDAAGAYSLLMPEVSEAERAAYERALEARFGAVESLDFWTISPSVSRELVGRSVTAILLVLFGISLYVTYAFRTVSYPVSSFKYGAVTLVTLAHDVLIPAGLFAVLGYARGIAVDTNFIVALLTVMGFSVHDTIVVFDRIRENLLKKTGESLALVVNRSVNETLHRSINTSLTLVLVLVALFLFGPLSTSYFVLAILVGTVVGTYSSIFVASPLLVLWQEFDNKRK